MPDIVGPRAQAIMTTLLAQTESDRRFEVKRVSGKMVGKALETICAFANTEGGFLVLGLEDPTRARGADRIVGIEENPEAVDELCRKLHTQFHPALEPQPRVVTVEAVHTSGALRTVMYIPVGKGRYVHSIVGDGTWTRLEATNRELTAAEIVTLTYNRGTTSVVNEGVEVELTLVDTPLFRAYLEARGLPSSRSLAERLHSLGLATRVSGKLCPIRAAILLFAEHPGSVMRSKAAIRVLHYSGMQANQAANPNLVDTPKTFDGPLVDQIGGAHTYVVSRLAMGLTMANSGFRAQHRYPERVIKEAITNAVIHRDYRIPSDIHIRIFDNRIEVESPGTLPGEITPQTIFEAGSLARNQLVVDHLREFPTPPNLDANEGVRMMRSEMRQQNLLEPRYEELSRAAGPSVLLTLLNEEQPPLWDQAAHWVKQHGSIDNAAMRQIANVDTLKASKLLSELVRKGLLVQDRERASRNMRYLLPHAAGKGVPPLFREDE